MSLNSAETDHPNRSVFVYGVLCFDKVLIALLQRLPDKTQHRVDGHIARLFELDGWMPFPVLLQHPTQQVDGFVLRGLTTQDLAILDRFEAAGHYYDRLPLLQLGDETVDYYKPTTKLLQDGTIGQAWQTEINQTLYAERYAEQVIPEFFASNPDLKL